MKIKVFESTATAIAALVEAAELVLGQPLQMGQHTIEFDPDPQSTDKLVKINGTLLGRNPNQPVRIDVGGHMFMVISNQQWILRGVASVFYLNHRPRPKTYRLTWNHETGRPALVD
jgi:hypothetical protein